MTTNAGENQLIAQTPTRQLAETLLIALVFFVATGDATPNVNETHYICRLKHYWNPAWCAGDLFLESTDTQVVFIWLFGWMTKLLSLSATAWVSRIIAWVFIGWSWQRLSWRIVPRPFAAVLSAALFMAFNYYFQMAGEWVVGGAEAKCFAYGFVILALREMIDRRWNMVCLMLGAAIAFHPIVGGWSALVCGTFWLIHGRLEQPLRAMIPGIVPALSLTWREPADLVAEANRIYVFERLPHHLAILALPSEEITSRLTRHAILLVAFVILSRVSRGERQTRSIVEFAWGAVIIACIGLTIELMLRNQSLTAAKIQRYYWYRLTDFAAPMAVALLATNTIANGIEARRRWATPVLAASLLFVGVYLGNTCWARVATPVPPADAKVVDYPAWVDVCDWIANDQNTPPNALFLTPRLNLSFKWRTGRPEVVNRKDIPQDARNMIDWFSRLKDIYYTKVGGIEQPLDSIGVLGTERVLELAKKYQAEFVLMDRGQLLSLPVVFKNNEYIVYKIENRSTVDSR
jgi:Domain of unknown function (DUF6798)